MTIQELVTKAHLALKDQDLAPAGDKLAVQINVTGKDAGIFYIEILNGRLSVEPYDYHDRDFSLTADSAEISRLISGRMNTVNAVAAGKLQIEGSMEKFDVLAGLFKAAAPKPAKKASAKAAPVKTAKKAPVKKPAAKTRKK